MHLLQPQLVFYVFATITVLSAFMVITQSNPVRCVLFLVLAFFATSILWLLVSAEFLALILVLVYVGAVMTLFLFVVMMLNIDIESTKNHFLKYMPFGLILVALLTGLSIKHQRLFLQWFHKRHLLIICQKLQL
jgi:NADH-quinone oxidoreductase subunit J